MAVRPTPEGYHSVTPYLTVRGAGDLLDYIKQAFGAEETVRMPGPDGRVMHGEARIGDSMVMMGDPGEGGEEIPAMIHLYVDDCDATYRRALQAGGTSVREPADQFYGDRSGGVKDRCGNTWWIATHVEDVAPEEMSKRMAAAAQA